MVGNPIINQIRDKKHSRQDKSIQSIYVTSSIITTTDSVTTNCAKARYNVVQYKYIPKIILPVLLLLLLFPYYYSLIIIIIIIPLLLFPYNNKNILISFVVKVINHRY